MRSSRPTEEDAVVAEEQGVVDVVAAVLQGVEGVVVGVVELRAEAAPGPGAEDHHNMTKGKVAQRDAPEAEAEVLELPEEVGEVPVEGGEEV